MALTQTLTEAPVPKAAEPAMPVLETSFFNRMIRDAQSEDRTQGENPCLIPAIGEQGTDVGRWRN